MARPGKGAGDKVLEDFDFHISEDESDLEDISSAVILRDILGHIVFSIKNKGSIEYGLILTVMGGIAAKELKDDSKAILAQIFAGLGRLEQQAVKSDDVRAIHQIAEILVEKIDVASFSALSQNWILDATEKFPTVNLILQTAGFRKEVPVVDAAAKAASEKAFSKKVMNKFHAEGTGGAGVAMTATEVEALLKGGKDHDKGGGGGAGAGPGSSGGSARG